jgi:hypothetical protein
MKVQLMKVEDRLMKMLFGNLAIWLMRRRAWTSGVFYGGSRFEGLGLWVIMDSVFFKNKKTERQVLSD